MTKNSLVGSISLKKYFIILVTAFIGFIATSCQKQAVSKDDFVINIAGNKVTVELAVTIKEQSKGLMYRNKLEPDHGMLFIFPHSRHASFWMKNTRIPLSIAFIKEDGWIAQIEDMKPQSLKTHISDVKVKYALEMEQGWFKKKSIKVGDFVEIPIKHTQLGHK